LEIGLVIVRLHDRDGNSRARSLDLAVSRDIRLNKGREETSQWLHVVRVHGKSTNVLGALGGTNTKRAKGWGDWGLRNSSLLEKAAETQERLGRAGNRSHFCNKQG
jgi:hypothetical protein